MNPFDTAVVLAAVTAIAFGFRAGLLRSAATILAYICAAPIALQATPLVSRMVIGGDLNPVQTMLAFFAVFTLLGVVIAAGLRAAIDDWSGGELGLVDRLGGSALGLVRVGLIGVTVILVLDRVFPPGRDPHFLAGSQLRPMFSLAAQFGLKSLPPETAAFIDRIKRQRQSQTSPSP